MRWLTAPIERAAAALFRNNYCVVAYYPENHTCDVYSFRTAEEAERYVEAVRILYGWADDVEWHVRFVFQPGVPKRVINDALAGKLGRIVAGDHKTVSSEDSHPRRRDG